MIRVTWQGGVTKPGGAEVDDQERQLYTVLFEGGPTRFDQPAALADLGDGDNNHKLCFEYEGTPVSVEFPAGFMTDPREDLNPKTSQNIFRKEGG